MGELRTKECINQVTARGLERRATAIKLKAEYPHLRGAWLDKQLTKIDQSLRAQSVAIRSGDIGMAHEARRWMHELVAEIM